MEIWYEIEHHHYKLPSITAVQVEKETELCVWVDGSRRNKHSWECSFIRDKEEARQKIIELLSNRIRKHESELVELRDRLKSAAEEL